MADAIVAIAVVTDCSLVVSQEWDFLFKNYIYQLFQRLHGGVQGGSPQIRLAFITYGTATARPGPIVCRRFFAPLMDVLKEMKEIPSSFGMGTLASGGGKGTAALEALVAATEMFDLLTTAVDTSQERRTLQPQSVNGTIPKSQVVAMRHIIHVAALAPDSSKRPLRNNSPAFDDTTWETLSDELKKRDIKWSMILPRQPLTRLVELHAKVEAEDSIAPWFQTRSTDSLYLVGLPRKVLERQALERKRTGAGESPSTPEPKRAKISGPGSQVSPIVSNSTPPRVAPAPVIAPKTNSSPIPSPVQPQAPTTPAMRSQQPAVKPSPSQAGVPGQRRPKEATLEEIEAHMKVVEADIRAIQERLPGLERGGLQEHMQKARLVLAQKMLSFDQLKQARVILLKRRQEQNAISDKGNSAGADMASMLQQSQAGLSMPNQNTAGLLYGQSINNNLGQSFPSGLPMGAHLMQGMQGSGNVQLPPSATPAAATDVDIQVQMQKLLDQRNNARQQDTGGAPQPAANSGQPAPQGQRMRTMWQGTIAVVSGNTLQTKFDVQVLSAVVLDAHTWPSMLQVRPAFMTTREELQMYLKAQPAILCHIHPLKPPVRPEVNVVRYEQVTQLLLTKNAYAHASWTHPADSRKHINFLIITLTTANEKRTFGAYWISDGPASLPSRQPGASPASASGPGGPKLDLSQLPAELQQRLLQIPPEKRAEIIQQMRARRAAVMQQARPMPHPSNQPGPSSQPLSQMGNPNVGNLFPGNNATNYMRMDGGGMQGRASNTGNGLPGMNSQNAFNFDPGNITQNQHGMGMNPNMGMPQGMGVNMNMGMGMGMGDGMGQNFGLQGGMAPQHQQQSGGNPAFPQGGVSFEMLQSFMQRNAEGGSAGAGS
ncbi:hypothetical protein OE88DRAFT_1810852 [Heliocybe sulcata]|uniref:Uncharacterized protein n=1 Tax=Heliocybe sulcata TaxID=5364 RepID=A0A5C3N1Y2_9AGAM|nr:hypothetical protein OE88DRAFT_1810852 [Heliocybe sulcata]